MKKVLLLLFAMVFVFSFVFCMPATTAQAAAKPKITEIKMPEKVAPKASATISFKVNQKCSASVEIYDTKNKLVLKLASKSVKKNATATFKWNGKNSKKKFVANGKYKIKIKAGSASVTKYITVVPKVNISELAVSSSFILGQEYAEVFFKVDQDCVTYIEILDSNYNSVAVYEKYNAKKGETVDTFAWDGTDMNDQFVPPGAYYIVVYADDVYDFALTSAQ